MRVDRLIEQFAQDWTHASFERSLVVLADCFEWMSRVGECSIDGVVTDPPYGVKEYDLDQLEKRSNGNGGIWRIPPSFDGNTRAPLPRFTALSTKDIARLNGFFTKWAGAVVRVLKPGGHVFLASNVYLSQSVFGAVVRGGLEFRGQIVRTVRTLRGGDRPKNAEKKYGDVCTMPRGCYEPWGIFRKPIPKGMRVSDCLAEHGTGGLRRRGNGSPFQDLIESEKTPRRERRIADHPSLKPQSFLRQLVYAVLPRGRGVVLDPFMGCGSTVAAAEAVGYSSVGVERHEAYYETSIQAIPQLARLYRRASYQRGLPGNWV